MAGRRRTGAFAGAIDLAAELMLEKQKEDRNRRARAEEISAKFQRDQQLAEEKFEREQQGRIDLEALKQEGRVDLKQTPSAEDEILGVLTPSQQTKLLGGQDPNQPLGAVPLGETGINTVNEAIAKGLTQSPAAESTGRSRFAVENGEPTGTRVPSGGARMLEQLATFVRRLTGGGGVAGSVPSAGQPQASALPPAPPAAVSVASPAAGAIQDPASQLVEVQQALSEGYTPQQILEQLLEDGVDQATALQLIQAATQ